VVPLAYAMGRLRGRSFARPEERLRSGWQCDGQTARLPMGGWWWRLAYAMGRLRGRSFATP